MKLTKYILVKLVNLHNRFANKDTLLMVQEPIKITMSSTKNLNVAEWRKKNASYLSNLINETKYDLRNDLAKQLDKDNLIDTTIAETEGSITIKMEIKVYETTGRKNSNDGVRNDSKSNSNSIEL